MRPAAPGGFGSEMGPDGQLDLADLCPHVVIEDDTERWQLAERVAQRRSWERVAEVAEEALTLRALGDVDRAAFSRLRVAALRAASFDPQRCQEPDRADLTG